MVYALFKNTRRRRLSEMIRSYDVKKNLHSIKNTRQCLTIGHKRTVRKQIGKFLVFFFFLEKLEFFWRVQKMYRDIHTQVCQCTYIYLYLVSPCVCVYRICFVHNGTNSILNQTRSTARGRGKIEQFQSKLRCALSVFEREPFL